MKKNCPLCEDGYKRTVEGSSVYALMCFYCRGTGESQGVINEIEEVFKKPISVMVSSSSLRRLPVPVAIYPRIART
jgi:hypothetical protein